MVINKLGHKRAFRAYSTNPGLMHCKGCTSFTVERRRQLTQYKAITVPPTKAKFTAGLHCLPQQPWPRRRHARAPARRADWPLVVGEGEAHKASLAGACRAATRARRHLLVSADWPLVDGRGRRCTRLLYSSGACRAARIKALTALLNDVDGTMKRSSRCDL